MKKAKKILLAGLVFAMVLAMTACGKNSTPSESVESELKAVQNESISDLEKTMPNTMDSSYSDDWKSFLKKIQKFDYKIKDEKIKGNKATVTVTIKTYDFGNAYQETYNQIVQDAQSGTITSSTDVTKYVYDLMFKNLLAVDKKTYSKDVVINCKKNDDGEWETDVQSNEQFLNAIMGGLEDKIAEKSSAQ